MAALPEVIPLPTDPAEARVAIARDVIEQIRARRVIASHGVYLDIFTADDIPTEYGSLREVIALPMRRCEACALGSMLLSRARLFNGVPSGGRFFHSQNLYLGFGSALDGLESIFGYDALEAIERAFEASAPEDGEVDEDDEDGDSVDPFVQFALDHPEPADRMIAIMENIIANRGEFVI